MSNPNLQSLSNILKNPSDRETPEPNNRVEDIPDTSESATPIPSPSVSAPIDGSQNQTEPIPAKTNPTRKGRNTRAAAKQQEKVQPTAKSSEMIESSQTTVRDIAEALGTSTQTNEPTEGGTQSTTAQEETTDDPEERAHRAQVTLDKAFKAQEEGDEQTANMFFNIHHSLLPQSKASKTPSLPKPSVSTTIEPIIISDDSVKIIPRKRGADKEQPTEVRHLKFKWGTSNDHSDGGFAPYFHKNILELRGPIPLTIFNKAWQARALVWHSANHSSSAAEKAEKNLRYYGLAVPDEYAQSHSDWTLNYGVFHETMKVSYKYTTLAEWILLHKANCDQMLSKDGFMVALRYDIKMRTNVWQFKPTIDGVEFISDFSEVRQDTYEEVYSEARANGELILKTANPYAIGGPREKWEAATGTPPARTAVAGPTPKATNQPPAPNQAPPTLPPKPATGKQPAGNNPGYQGSSYNPNFRSRGNRGQGGGQRE
ncbi:hypothetical protein Pst134EB_026517 [Puccinia striiformis f. sp. tritici]|uniref:Uncharacterized protein n=1 Tax=Puccinia striiformis f. sp. tritici PST-78 TaxID=1165861 RepID=A0A0L0UVC2_9BASI|nr:hypothetical protein Pst134EB_026517 [Puccinia striiformis f. sp. tritici]KNE90978.1 hypothetical protein PSTG_15581 [Puccinia striiformis f. sp. tritici PST-78]